MENNLSNKQKFFAQYWGQKIGIPVNSYAGMLTINKSCIGNIKSLELTPLSMISDEDAIEVAKMFESSAYKVKYNDYGNIGFSFYVGEESESVEVSPEWDRVAVDYLRSKGYAITYLNLEVEQQISYGWVKLKTE